jgi:pilus assembly protein CpaE
MNLLLPRPFSSDPEKERPPFLAFIGDETSRGLISAIAVRRGWAPSAVRPGGVPEAISAFKESESPRLLVVDLDGAAEPRREVARLAAVCDPETAVIALGAVNDVPLYRDLRTAGVLDYLVKPLSPGILERALDAACAPADAPAEADRGRLIAFSGVRGGIGASTVALNTAWLLAHEKGRRTALVDLDLRFGTAALLLDLEAGRGLREALENPDRIDELFIERAAIRASDTLFVLGAEEPLEDRFLVDPGALEVLVSTLRQNFEQLVLDVPRTVLATQCGSLFSADDLYLVADSSIVSLRETIRILAALRSVSPAAKPRVVLNATAPLRDGSPAVKEFEQAAGVAIEQVIPFDGRAMERSAGGGRPVCVAAPRSKMTRSLRRFADSLVVEEAPARASLWRRLTQAA